jgi:antitoxin (DNA-binding transcriptional repressor) of toxin-antitoxin stability system
VDPWGMESNNSWATYGANGVITGEIGIEANPAIDPIEIVVGAGAARRLYQEGSEFVIRRSGRQVARIAPFGNRTGHPVGRFPHYHRARPHPTRPGHSLRDQSMRRHRPFESRPSDTSFWDRF